MELSRSYPFSCAFFYKIFLRIRQIDNETKKKEEISCENNGALQLEC